MSSCIICYETVTKLHKYCKYDKHDLLIHQKCLKKWYETKSDICIYCNKPVLEINFNVKHKCIIIQHSNENITYNELIIAFRERNFFEVRRMAAFVNKYKINVFELLIENNDFYLFKFIINNGYDFDFKAHYFYLSLEKYDYSLYILSKLEYKIFEEHIIYDDTEIEEIINILVYNNNFKALKKIHNISIMPNKITNELFEHILYYKKYKIMLFLYFHFYLTSEMQKKLLKHFIINVIVLGFYTFLIKSYFHIIMNFLTKLNNIEFNMDNIY